MLLQAESDIIRFIFNLDPLLFGAIILVALFATYLGVMRLRYKNDPYFPYFLSKNLDDVIILLSERTPTGLAFIGTIKGKWGKHGLYIPDLDRIYTDVQFMSGKQKVVHLTKGVDGLYHPAGISVVQTGVEYKKKTVELGTPEEPVEVDSVEEIKTAKVIEGKFKDKKEAESFLALIIPSLEEYRLTLSSYVETYYQTISNAFLKNVNPGNKTFIKKMFEDLDRDKLVLLMIMGALLILYFLISDGITAMTRVCAIAPPPEQANPIVQILNGTG